MIAINELRIANLVLNNEGKPSKIIEISHIGTVLLNDLTFWEPETEWGQHCNEISPIPLTPEILEKSCKSWRTFHDGVIIFEFGAFDFWSQNGSVWIECRFGEHLEHINTVHSMQNLYFALTHQELEVKL